MENTPMTQIIDKGLDITVEMEHTIKTGDYENLKPRLSTTVTGFEDVPATLKLFRKILAGEHTDIKSKIGGRK